MNGNTIPVKDAGVSYRINWILKSLWVVKDDFSNVG